MQKGVQDQYEHDVPKEVSGECIYSNCREICFHSNVIKLMALHFVFKALKEKLLRNYIEVSILNSCLSHFWNQKADLSIFGVSKTKPQVTEKQPRIKIAIE